LEQDTLLELWQESVPLGHSWWVFADERNQNRFLELQRDDRHLGLQGSLERDIVGHLYSGELQAIGIEIRNDPKLTRIPAYFFLQTAVVNFDRDTVESLGKKFVDVRIQDDRNPVYDRAPADLDPATASSDLAPAPNDELQEAGEALGSEPEPANSQTPSIDPAAVSEPAGKGEARKRLGRPPLVPKLRKLVRELINQGKFEGKSKKEITALVGEKARECFKHDFYSPNRPSKPTIYAALDAERGSKHKSKKSKKLV
jgi:hypothetical protein